MAMSRSTKPRPRHQPRVEALEERLALNGGAAAPAIEVQYPAAAVDKGSGDPLIAPRNHVFADAVSGNPGVISPSRPYRGASYAEWSARWWEYVYSIPADKNPLLDNGGPNNPGGGNFSVGQSGSVWYLAGTGTPFGVPASSTVTRDVTLPAGKALFFPVLTVQVDNLNLTPGDPNFGTQSGNLTADEMRDLAKPIVDNAIGLSGTTKGHLTASVDGKSINDLSQYRVTSPVFSYTLGPNNVVSAMTGQTVPPQTVSPAVADGVYLMLAPLSVGQHTIHFTGEAPEYSFSLDVTYHITVTENTQ